MKRDAKKECHSNTPKELVSLFIQCNRKYHDLANKIHVNVRYVYDLLHYGKEPTKKTIKGRDARKKLFLDEKKTVPDYIKKWRHLPTSERQKVIRQYLEWRKNV